MVAFNNSLLLNLGITLRKESHVMLCRVVVRSSDRENAGNSAAQ